MSTNLEYKHFGDIDIDDPFFESLKADYKTFGDWFRRKSAECAYVKYNGDMELEGFAYFKLEKGELQGVTPVINADKTLKIGPHGTRLGERFIKKALDYAIISSVDLVYVTIFEKHSALINLFKKYGFLEIGLKSTSDGIELAFGKRLDIHCGNLYRDFPLVAPRNKSKYLLSIYPEYHTVMFPDSILHTESVNIIKDISYTNSIHKSYISRMNDISLIKRGDILVIYRTASGNLSAEYSSVATSICVVDNVLPQSNFMDFESFYSQASKYSVFDKNDLHYWFKRGGCYIIDMTYNIALPKRLTRHILADEIGLNRSSYWGVLKITDDQFDKILIRSEVHEGFVVN